MSRPIDSSDIRSDQHDQNADLTQIGRAPEFNPDRLAEAQKAVEDQKTPHEGVDDVTPQTFGTHAHIAYIDAAQDRIDRDKVWGEVEVRTSDTDGNLKDGKVDLLVDDKVIDFKTNDMRDWSETTARRFGHEHGKQVQGYVESPDTPENAEGYVISSVPPKSEDVRDTYTQALQDHGVDVRFSKSEAPEDVAEAAADIVENDKD